MNGWEGKKFFEWTKVRKFHIHKSCVFVSLLHTSQNVIQFIVTNKKCYRRRATNNISSERKCEKRKWNGFSCWEREISGTRVESLFINLSLFLFRVGRITNSDINSRIEPTTKTKETKSPNNSNNNHRSRKEKGKKRVKMLNSYSYTPFMFGYKFIEEYKCNEFVKHNSSHSSI